MKKMRPAKKLFLLIGLYLLSMLLFSASNHFVKNAWAIVLNETMSWVAPSPWPSTPVSLGTTYTLSATVDNIACGRSYMIWYTKPGGTTGYIDKHNACSRAGETSGGSMTLTGSYTIDAVGVHTFYVARACNGCNLMGANTITGSQESIVWNPPGSWSADIDETFYFNVRVNYLQVGSIYELYYVTPSGLSGRISNQAWGIYANNSNVLYATYIPDTQCTHTINLKKDGLTISSQSLTVLPCSTKFNANTGTPSCTEDPNTSWATLHYYSALSPIPPDGEIVVNDPAFYKNSVTGDVWCSTVPVEQSSPGSFYINCDKCFSGPPLCSGPYRCSEVPSKFKENICVYVNNTRQTNACGGGPSGPTDPFLTGFNIVANSCKNYGSDFYCQLYASALGVGGSYRFGAATGGTITKVAEFSNAAIDYIPVNETWGSLAWMLFRPSRNGRLESIDVWAKNPGGYTWMNMRLAEDDDCDSPTCPIAPAIVDPDTHQAAEAGGYIDAVSPFSNWVNFSFLGSRPMLYSNKNYKIYVKYHRGQHSSVQPDLRAWRHSVDGSPVDDRFYRVWARINPSSDAGGFTDTLANPIYPYCTGPAPTCYIWWKAPASGYYNFSADTLAPKTPGSWLDIYTGLSATTLTTDTTINLSANPWFQNLGGDIHAIGTISSPIPSTAANKNFSRDLDSYPGVITYGPLSNTPSYQPSGTISSTSWQAKAAFVPPYSYDYFYRKLGSPTEVNYPCKTGVSPCPDPPNPPAGKTTVYYTNQKVTIGGNWTIPANTKVIVLVGNDLEINKTITVPVGSFLAFIVKGNINISGEVGDKNPAGSTVHLQGVYFTDGFIDTYSDKPAVGQGSGKRLVAGGMFYTKTGFNLRRDLKNDTIPPAAINNETQPGELFIFRPDLIANVPLELLFSSMSWQEASP